MPRLLLLVLILRCGLSAAASAQEGVTTVDNPDLCGNLTTASQCVAKNLAAHHIPLTMDGLMSALHSDDISLRNLAIYELAEMGATESVPDLLALLDSETEPDERISLADALAKLGNQRGVPTLEAYCNDKSAPLGARLNAAARLLAYEPRSCPDALLEGLQSSLFRNEAMSLIPRFKELSPGESSQVRAILVRSLSDADSGGRIQAAGLIAELRDMSALPALKAAAAKETDPATRSAMEYYLKTLQDKNQSSVSDTAK